MKNCYPYPLVSLFINNKNINESDYIKYRALEIIYKKDEKNIYTEDMAFDFYKNQNQIMFLDNNVFVFESENEVFKTICNKAVKNPKKNFVLIINHYQKNEFDNIYSDIEILLKQNNKSLWKNEVPDSSIPNNIYILGIINQNYKLNEGIAV